MKVRVPNYFKEFKCIASKCEDTCCAGWEIVIDEESYEKYKEVRGDFKEELRSKIVKSEGENIFLLNKGNCAFLNEKKMCEIYINLGEEYLCYTCREFPRYREEFFDLREIGLSLSCPEAARIILRSKDNISFYLEEAPKKEEEDLEDFLDREVFSDFLRGRERIFSFFLEEDFTLREGMALALYLSRDMQDKIDLGDMDEISSLLDEYEDRDFLRKLLKEREEFKGEYSNILREDLSFYKRIKHINSKDPLNLEKALEILSKGEDFYLGKREDFLNYYREDLYKFKNIFVYFIFRYFMKAIFDYDISAKVKLAIISTLVIEHLALLRFLERGEKFTFSDMVEISRIYSKDIEHSEENVENLQEFFEREEAFSFENIMALLR